MGVSIFVPLVAVGSVDQPLYVYPFLIGVGNVNEFPLFVSTDVGDTLPPLAFSVVKQNVMFVLVDTFPLVSLTTRLYVSGLDIVLDTVVLVGAPETLVYVLLE